MAKPKLLVLQGGKFDFIPTYAESNFVAEKFDIEKADTIQGKPDLIYCQAYGAFYKQLLETDIPFVLHMGGNPWLELKGKRLENCTKILRKAKHVTTVSKFLQDEIRKGLGGASHVQALPGGLWGQFHTDLAPRPSRFQKKLDYELHNPPIMVMSIGLRDEPVIKNKWSGLEFFLENAKWLIDKYNMKILCAARGDYNFSRLDLWREKYNFSFINSHHCHSEADYWPELLTGSDIFVHPSSYDCWPRVIAEAMLVGLPVFAFDITGNKEVSDYICLVKPKDVDYMIKRIDWQLQSEKDRRLAGVSLRNEAYRLMEKHKYDFANILEQTLQGI